ncbi:MAG: DNA starvation/stationary phase protection protein, partial [Chlorobia bacterium]|nr:DNA starvation/stationary phase protection protein [Fimbriimonadaceae bacterium]
MATKTKNRNEIFDDKTTKQIASELQPVLSDLIALGLIVKQAHWNVTGSSFRAVHLQLDEIWATVQTNVDEVAERLSTLAVSPAGQANEVAASSKVDQIPAGFMDASKVVDFMTERVGQ